MIDKLYVPKTHLVVGLCLPLAVLLGYFIAEPMDLGSLGVVVVVVAVLCVPLMMKWHYPLLLFSCSAPISLWFLPGTPPLWMAAAAMGFVFVVLNRFVDLDRPLMVGGAVAKALAALIIVVVVTAFMTGGLGLRSLGAMSTYGGKKYFFLLLGILTYFGLATHRVPSARAGFYAALFFLPGMLAMLSTLAAYGGPGFSSLYNILPPEQGAIESLAKGAFGPEIVRLGALDMACVAGYMFLLLRYGLGGILDWNRPWRFALALLFLAGVLLGGFRSNIGFVFLVSALLFFMERLYRRREVFSIAVLGVLCAGGLVVFSTKLPLSMQRAVSFLPIEVIPTVKLNAQDSWEWRLGMWQDMISEIPHCLLKGKGYGLDADKLFKALQGGAGNARWEASAVAGDYHNGPLSVVIPFGLWGVLAVAWFFAAAIRRLYRNYVQGNPALKKINRLLLAYFIIKVVFFVFLFGALDSDMVFLAGMAGLGVSLNRDVEDVAAEDAAAPAKELEVDRNREFA